MIQEEKTFSVRPGQTGSSEQRFSATVNYARKTIEPYRPHRHRPGNPFYLEYLCQHVLSHHPTTGLHPIGIVFHEYKTLLFRCFFGLFRTRKFRFFVYYPVFYLPAKLRYRKHADIDGIRPLKIFVLAPICFLPNWKRIIFAGKCKQIIIKKSRHVLKYQKRLYLCGAHL